MKEIPLTKRYTAFVDDEDFERVSKHKWCISENKTRYYAASHIPGTGHSVMKMHRFILGFPYGKVSVDHIDGNGLNNQRSNLRICTQAQNSCNTAASRSNNTSGYKGVIKSKNGKRWVAQVAFDYRCYKIGTFDTAIEAAQAYDAKAKELHGEFANLNFK